jgi:DNA-binding IscR family transcriptional regulator
MRLSTKGRFAVTAMIDVALRRKAGVRWRKKCEARRYAGFCAPRSPGA